MTTNDCAYALKELLLILVDEKDKFTVAVKENSDGSPAFFIIVASKDIKRIIGVGGKMYRSLKTLICASLKNSTATLTVDIAS